MKRPGHAKDLIGIYNRLLEMTEEQKRRILDTFHAPTAKEWTRDDKAGVLREMAIGFSLEGMAGELSATLATDKERLLALDILREPTQVVRLATMARTLGVERRTARGIEKGTQAHYLAFTFGGCAERRVNAILDGIRGVIESETEEPETAKNWTAAAICNLAGR